LQLTDSNDILQYIYALRLQIPQSTRAASAT
jgi:hypothetical protein